MVSGSAANPVTRAHREFAETLTQSGMFDLVLWLPSGLRPDKPHLIESAHRVRMTELVFSEAWRAEQPTEFCIDLRDATRANTPTIYLLEDLKKTYLDAEIIFATGVDVLTPKKELDGKCEVHLWDEGERLLSQWTFAVAPRAGYPDPHTLKQDGHLPAHFMILDRPHSPIGNASSTEIRNRIKQGLSYSDLVIPEVGAYIEAHKLYQ